MVLYRATEEEREAFRRLLDTNVCANNSPEELVKGMRWLHRNLLEAVFRKLFDKDETYSDILVSICKKLDVRARKDEPAWVLEGKICQAVMRAVWERMTPQQRAAFDQEVARAAEQFGSGREWMKAGGAVGALLAAEASGFGIYLLATSGLAAVAGLAGITLPFAAYTSLTTAMGVVLGPVGWVGTGLYAIWKVTGPNYPKLIRAVLYLAMLRQKYCRWEPPARDVTPYILAGAVLFFAVVGGVVVWLRNSPNETPQAPAAITAQSSVSENVAASTTGATPPSGNFSLGNGAMVPILGDGGAGQDRPSSLTCEQVVRALRSGSCSRREEDQTVFRPSRGCGVVSLVGQTVAWRVVVTEAMPPYLTFKCKDSDRSAAGTAQLIGENASFGRLNWYAFRGSYMLRGRIDVPRSGDPASIKITSAYVASQ